MNQQSKENQAYLGYVSDEELITLIKATVERWTMKDIKHLYRKTALEPNELIFLNEIIRHHFIYYGSTSVQNSIHDILQLVASYHVVTQRLIDIRLVKYKGLIANSRKFEDFLALYKQLLKGNTTC